MNYLANRDTQRCAIVTLFQFCPLFCVWMLPARYSPSRCQLSRNFIESLNLLFMFPAQRRFLCFITRRFCILTLLLSYAINGSLQSHLFGGTETEDSCSRNILLRFLAVPLVLFNWVEDKASSWF